MLWLEAYIWHKWLVAESLDKKINKSFYRFICVMLGEICLFRIINL
jgi:hypothetical protein